MRGLYDDQGRPINGVREIKENEADVVRRIYREYASGRSALEIARSLNDDGIPGIDGRPWTPKTLRGKGGPSFEGILRNEVYLGRLVYNKCVTVRDPVTGRKRYIPRPSAEWTRVDKPEWRIVDDDLWASVRKMETQRNTPPAPPPKKPRILTTHNVHALTGWVFCGVCGAPKSIANDSRYTCCGNRYRNTCGNSRGTKEAVLLEMTFAALTARVRGKPDFRPSFLRAFAQEIDRSTFVRSQERNISARIDRLLKAIEDGVNQETATRRIVDLQNQLAEIHGTMGRVLLPDLPSEDVIRDQLSNAVMTAIHGSIEDQRVMFGHVLKAITLTPIPDQYRGESITVELREEGWPEFWRTHQTS